MVEEDLSMELPLLAPRYNVAPTQSMPVVRGDAERTAGLVKWGALARFDPTKAPSLLINARSETAQQKVTFRKAAAERRCLVPADGFYEWRRESPTSKTPFMIQMSGGEPFFIAGLRLDDAVDATERYLLLTTRPNALMETIHDRMPVILRGANALKWLEPRPLTPEEFAGLVEPLPAESMQATEVSSLVNNARNDTPGVIEPAGKAAQGPERGAGG